MRLFIAVEFDDAAKDAICGCMEKVKDRVIAGNFTRRANLHLTLAFIGESSRVPEIRAAMDSVESGPFIISPTDVGRFMRSGGDLWYIKMSGEKELGGINRQLVKSLTALGVQVDEKPFKPHLTIAREVEEPTDFSSDELSGFTPEFEAQVTAISLMKSERVGRKIKYTAIYTRRL